MSIKEIMEIGTTGMTAEQKEAEQARRMKVADKLNLLGNRVYGGKMALRMCEKGSDDAKKLTRQIRSWEREIVHIKATESDWLKQAAWFLY